MQMVGIDVTRDWHTRTTGLLPPLVCVLAVALLTGCKTAEKAPPVPMTPPPATVSARHFSGTTLSGPLARRVPIADAGAAQVNARVVVATKLPSDDFTPIGPLARLVLRDGEGDLVAPSGQLGYATRFRTLDQAASLDDMLGDRVGWAEMGKVSGVVARGTTLAIDIAPPTDGGGGAGTVSIQLFRTTDGNRYELAIERDEPLRAAPSTQPTVARTARETIVISRDLTNAGASVQRMLLTLPMTFTNTPVTGVVIDLTINFAPADIGALVEQANKEIDASAARETARMQATPPADPALMAARESLTSAGENARRPLTYLAQLTGARIAEGVALVGDDSLVTLIARNVRDKLGQVKADDAASVGWLLEQSTIKAVVSIKDAENASITLAPVMGVMQGIAGQAGVQLDVLQSVAAESAGTADLYSRLIAEHLIFLDDSSPAVRVRSFDWLKARQKEPSEFDPLARPKERRAALEKFRDRGSVATAPTTQPR